VSGGFTSLFMGPINFVDLKEKSKMISLTSHLIRISKHLTDVEAPTPMLGCTNVFPNFICEVLFSQRPMTHV
jgi:hypothetical protein